MGWLRRKFGARVDFDFNDKKFWRDIARGCMAEENCVGRLELAYLEYRAELRKDMSPYYTSHVPASWSLPQAALDVLKERENGTGRV